MKQRNVFIALFLNGALLTLGFAPFGLWPLGFIAIPNFLCALVTASTVRAAALRGFAFGYGFSIAGTYWIANALLVDADKFAWLWPISVLGLSAVMALWFGALGALTYCVIARPSGFGNPSSSTDMKIDCHAIARNDGVCGSAELLIRFSIVWVSIEYLRSLGIFGFPWNLLGSMAVAVPEVLQLASVVGTYGVSFLLVLLFALPYLWMQEPVRHRLLVTWVVVLLVVAAAAYGSWRIPAQAAMTKTNVRVVQGNIPQAQKWTDEGAYAAQRSYSELTRMPSANGPIPRIIIWPETAVPATWRKGAIWPIQVGQLLPQNGILLTGALRFETEPEKKLWNSLLVISEHGAIKAMYDKHHLVPFGEFMPLRDVLPLEKVTPGDLDFTRGEGVKNFALEPIPPFRPLICYEVIFPWYAGGERAQWLLNVTNDAWYGNSPGPYQHLVAAQLRAVEQGLPLVRAANTGISAIVDPYGRIINKLPLDARGVIDHPLPAPLAPTPYARWGEWLTLGLMLIACFLMLGCRIRANSK